MAGNAVAADEGFMELPFDNTPEEKSVGEKDKSGENAEITLKFGKGLAHNFTGKDGKEYVEIKIPNKDENDKTPWEHFVLPANHVHENQFGKGLWAKIPENGETKLVRGVPPKEEGGKWGRSERKIPNTELKSLVEHYKGKGEWQAGIDAQKTEVKAKSEKKQTKVKTSHGRTER